MQLPKRTRCGGLAQSHAFSLGITAVSARIKVRDFLEQSMDDQEFKNRADESLETLYQRLAAASDDAEFEVDFNGGALAIEFEEPPGKFVISPNAPVHQIWVSAHSKSYKLDWDSVEHEFVLQSSGQTLTELIQDAITKQLGEEVSL
jgi:iron-sulfur cluster assembly protein CyaY